MAASGPGPGLQAAGLLVCAIVSIGYSLIDYVPKARPAPWVQPTFFYVGMAVLAAALVQAIRGSFRRDRPVDRGIAWIVALWGTVLLAWILAMVLGIIH